MNTTDNLIQINDVSNITIIVKDYTNAFTKYLVSITVDPLISPIYAINSIFNLNWSSFTTFPLKIQSNSKVSVVDCKSNIISNFIHVDQLASLLILNFTSVTRWNTMWIKFVSLDSCNIKKFSDEIWLYFDEINAPAITNTFGPISTIKGTLKIFQIPSDLFTDLQNLKVVYSIEYRDWIKSSPSKTLLQLSTQESTNTHHLYVQVNDTFGKQRCYSGK